MRFEVLAQRSPGGSTSSFMAMHMLHPESRHSKPASTKIRSSPSASAWRLIWVEAGTTSACFSDPEMRLPASTLAAARKSSIWPLLQEPMKTRSIGMSTIRVPGFRSM